MSLRSIVVIGLVTLAAGVAMALHRYVSTGAAAVFAGIVLVPFVPLPALRFLAGIFLLIATVAVVSDLSPALSGAGAFEPTALAEHWSQVGPASFNAARAALSKSATPWVWDSVLEPLLSWPTFLLFGALALLCGYAGRRRREVKIFVN